MTVNKLAGLVGAVTVLVGAVLAPIKFFQSKAEAAEQKEQLQKSVNELRAEVLLKRVNDLNAKEAKEKLTPEEKSERELNMALVKQIQAEAIKK